MANLPAAKSLGSVSQLTAPGGLTSYFLFRSIMNCSPSTEAGALKKTLLPALLSNTFWPASIASA